MLSLWWFLGKIVYYNHGQNIISTKYIGERMNNDRQTDFVSLILSTIVVLLSPTSKPDSSIAK